MNISFEDKILSASWLAIHGAASAVVKTSNNFSYTNGDHIVSLLAADLPALPSTVIPTGYTGVFTLVGDYNGNVFWEQGSNFLTPLVYNFVFSGVTAIPQAGAQYTNNSQTFTVLSVAGVTGSAGSYAGQIALSGTGAPSAGAQTLTKTAGSANQAWDATISTSSHTQSYQIPYSVLPNTPAYALTNNPQVLYVPRPLVGTTAFAGSDDVTFLGEVIVINGTGSNFIGGTTALDTASLTVLYGDRDLWGY